MATAVGRGRGFRDRSSIVESKEQLRRPKDVEPPSQQTEERWLSPIDMLTKKISILQAGNPYQLDDIKQGITGYCVDEKRLILLMNTLHERSLIDRQFGENTVLALATISQFSIHDAKLRTILIQILQNDFLTASTLFKVDKSSFLNAVAFLGEVFNRINLINNAPIAVLAIALVEYMKLLVGGLELDLELCVNMLALNGKKILSCKPQLMEEFNLEVYAALLKETTVRSRAWLLLAMQLDKHSFDVLPESVCHLIEEALGKKAIIQVCTLLARPQQIGAEISIPPLNELTLDSADIGIPQTARLSSLPSYQTETMLNTGPQKNLASANRVPIDRGARGDGWESPPKSRGNDSRNERANWLPKPSRTAEDMEKWGLAPSRQKNHDGHDDRCKIDYYNN